MANLAESGCRSESSSNPERGLHPPISDLAKLNKVTKHHKLLCQSSQEPLPVGGITSAYGQKRSRAGKQSKMSGFFQPTIFGAQIQQHVETYTRSEQFKPISQGSKVQSGDTGNHQNLSPTRGVGYLNRLLPHSNTGIIQEISEISRPGSDIPVQSTDIRFVHSTHGVHCSTKGGETDFHTQGCKDPPIPRRLVGESQIPPNLSPAYTGSSNNVSTVRLAGDFREIRARTKTSLRFCRLPVRPQVRWQNLQEKILKLLSLQACPVRQFMSLIGLLTATEKQVHLGRLHMRPIQWHLINNWRVPESTTTPNKACSADLYRRIKRRVGCSLRQVHYKRILVPSRKQDAYKLSRTQSSVSSLKKCQDFCSDKIVLVAADNTTVVSYINKEGGMRSGPLYALLWRILTWCTRKQVTLKA